jgi:aconitate hydratase
VAQELSQVTDSMFKKEYAKVFESDENWQTIPAHATTTYAFDKDSTYIQLPPYFKVLL